MLKIDSKSYFETHNISNSMKKHKIQKESEIKGQPENHTHDHWIDKIGISCFRFSLNLNIGRLQFFPVSWSDVFRSHVLRKKNKLAK